MNKLKNLLFMLCAGLFLATGFVGLKGAVLGEFEPEDDPAAEEVVEIGVGEQVGMQPGEQVGMQPGEQVGMQPAGAEEEAGFFFPEEEVWPEEPAVAQPAAEAEEAEAKAEDYPQRAALSKEVAVFLVDGKKLNLNLGERRPRPGLGNRKSVQQKVKQLEELWKKGEFAKARDQILNWALVATQAGTLRMWAKKHNEMVRDYDFDEESEYDESEEY